MQNIARSLLAKLRLTSDSRARGRGPGGSQPAEPAQTLDTLEAASSSAAPSARALQPSEGLSTRDALAALKRAQRLPTAAHRSGRTHAKGVLQAMEPAERASVVDGISRLLPAKADAALFDAVSDFLLSLPQGERQALSRGFSHLASRTALESGASAHAYVALLRTVHSLPARDRPTLFNAALTAQGIWEQGFPAYGWNQLLQGLAAGPLAEAMPRAREIRELYRQPRMDQNRISDFLDNATRHLRLDVAERDSFVEGYRALFMQAPRREHSGRATLAGILLRAEPEERAQHLGVLRALMRGLQLELTPWVVRETQEALARPLRDPVERRECISMVRQAISADRRAHHSWLLLRTLLQVPRAERAVAFELAREALGRGVFSRSFADESIVEAAPAARREHLVRLCGGTAASRPAAREGGAEDLENVMQGALRRQVDEAEARLRLRLGEPLSVTRALGEIEHYLRSARQLARTRPGHVLQRQRGGDSEINNALRTLAGASRPGDFSRAVRATPPMAALCALVWQAIGAPRPHVRPAQAARDRDLMRHGLAMALARCIEDDGHRVCGVGQRQYLVDVLKGYYPEAGDAQASVTPRSLVTVLTADFHSSHQDQPDAAPTPEQVQAFTARARTVATERFGVGTPELEEFTEQLDAYMRMTY